MPNVTQPDNLSAVQRRRKHVMFAGAIVGIPLLTVLASLGDAESWSHETIEASGLVLIVLCILGRTWSTLYVGGKKRRTLVTDGPYSLVRNPLYVFSILGAFGVGLTSGSVLIGALVAGITLMVFSGVVISEEAYLSAAFDGQFAAYAGRVPRWWPKISAWRDSSEVLVNPKLVLITFRDACLFLIAVPLFEQIDHLHEIGWLPVLLRLP